MPKSRTYGSVRVKAEWLCYSTIARKLPICAENARTGPPGGGNRIARRHRRVGNTPFGLCVRTSMPRKLTYSDLPELGGAFN
jgi:hypothetical protein